MNNKLLKAGFSGFLFFLFFASASAQQQATGEITGRVININKEPVFSAVVGIEGTTIGKPTNEKGEFKLTNIPIGDKILLVSGVGIETLKIVLRVTTVGLDLGDIEINNSVELQAVAIQGKSETRKQQQQPFAITVIDIKKAYAAATPLSRLLNNVTSVRVREDGGMGSNYKFSLNGFSGNQVKFFLDGTPMDNFGSSFNLSNISVNMAERVEIYKGVLPVSLGGDALGGAVNIVTRKDANYLDASYSIGSFNTHRISVNAAYTNLNTGFTIRANTFYNYSDNDYKVFVPITDLSNGNRLGEQWVKRFNDKYEAGGIKLESGIVNRPFADYLLAGIILSKNDQDVQTGATMEAVYGGVKAKSESMIPSLRYKISDLFIQGLSLSAQGAYSAANSFKLDTLARTYNWDGDWVETEKNGETPAPTDSKIQNRQWLANLNLTYALNDHYSISLNHVYSSTKRRIFDKKDPENENNKIPQRLTKNITGLGWITQYERWNVNVFAKLYETTSHSFKRFNEYTDNAEWRKVNDHKSHFGYGAAATYFILPNLQTKASYEKAFRLPESSEMFGDGLIQQRNPDLRPENSHNVNLGMTFEQKIAEHTIFAETNLIYRDTKDFILKSVNRTSNPTDGYRNMGKVLTKGIEGSLKYQYKKLFHAGLGFTYQDIIDNQKFEINDQSYVGAGVTEYVNYKFRLPNIPYFFGHGSMGFQFRNIGIKNTELTVDYFTNYVKEYFLSFPGLGARATKGIIPKQLSHDIALGYILKGGKYSVMAECSNFTNEKIYDNYFLQKPGRTFNLKFRYFLK